MKPGRELDKMVAEAMGWVRVDDCPLGDSFCPGKYLTPEGERRCCLPFSTEAAPAMQAWEWLEKNHAWGSICLVNSLGNPSVVTTDRGVLDKTLTTGDTYPHAIALAVLATKEDDQC